ncbi:MAG TPA: WD40 repeat domain-containing protein, partial [Aggregatilineaceae bacterium]|nr:WD40 repeat domain-containing protein [Aggregatilineaceae bacterium]
GKVVFADWNGTFQVWDAATNTVIEQRPEYMDWIVWLSWDHDVIRAATDDGRLIGWDANSGELWSVDQTSLDGLPTNWTSPDGTRRAEIDETGIMRIFDAATNQQLAEFPGLANTIAWSADSKLIAVAMRNGTIKIWGEA